MDWVGAFKTFELVNRDAMQLALLLSVFFAFHFNPSLLDLFFNDLALWRLTRYDAQRLPFSFVIFWTLDDLVIILNCLEVYDVWRNLLVRRSGCIYVLLLFLQLCSRIKNRLDWRNHWLLCSAVEVDLSTLDSNGTWAKLPWFARRILAKFLFCLVLLVELDWYVAERACLLIYLFQRTDTHTHVLSNTTHLKIKLWIFFNVLAA